MCPTCEYFKLVAKEYLLVEGPNRDGSIQSFGEQGVHGRPIIGYSGPRRDRLFRSRCGPQGGNITLRGFGWSDFFRSYKTHFLYGGLDNITLIFVCPACRGSWPRGDNLGTFPGFQRWMDVELEVGIAGAGAAVKHCTQQSRL